MPTTFPLYGVVSLPMCLLPCNYRAIWGMWHPGRDGVTHEVTPQRSHRLPHALTTQRSHCLPHARSHYTEESSSSARTPRGSACAPKDGTGGSSELACVCGLACTSTVTVAVSPPCSHIVYTAPSVENVAQTELPHSLHSSLSLGNIFNILPCAQGSDLSWTCSNVTYHYCWFMIGHSLGRMGIRMEEHTCEAKLPHINGNVERKVDLSGRKVAVHPSEFCVFPASTTFAPWSLCRLPSSLASPCHCSRSGH